MIKWLKANWSILAWATPAPVTVLAAGWVILSMLNSIENDVIKLDNIVNDIYGPKIEEIQGLDSRVSEVEFQLRLLAGRLDHAERELDISTRIIELMQAAADAQSAASRAQTAVEIRQALDAALGSLSREGDE